MVASLFSVSLSVWLNSAMYFLEFAFCKPLGLVIVPDLTSLFSWFGVLFLTRELYCHICIWQCCGLRLADRCHVFLPSELDSYICLSASFTQHLLGSQVLCWGHRHECYMSLLSHRDRQILKRRRAAVGYCSGVRRVCCQEDEWTSSGRPEGRGQDVHERIRTRARCFLET